VTDQDAERQIASIAQWFKELGVLLAFDQLGESWIAMMMPEHQRLGSAPAAHGDTKLEAAENARAVYEGRARPGTIEQSASGDVTIHVPVAEVTAQAGAVTIEVTDAATAADSAEVIRKAEDRLLEFGWLLGFAREPDGSYSWLVSDENTGDALKSGTADTWDDAKLAAIIDLLPPSGEV
jgi:hypothetical protein